MNRYNSIYVFLTVIVLGLFSCTKELVYNPISENGNSDDSEIDSNEKAASVTVANPGTLKQSLSSVDAMELTSLTVSGSINGSDLKFIREMAGADNVGNETNGKLTKLDLSATQFVSGGEAPFIYEGTPCEMSSDNVVPRYAFGYCKLKEILLPENITSFGAQAFYSCTNLESINIPSALEEIRRSAFYDCQALSSPIIIPEKVTAIMDYVFYNCSALTQLTLPNTIRSIGFASFYKCENLTDFGNDLDNLDTIDKFSFAGCSSLQRLYLPKSITIIPQASFGGCKSIQGVVDLSAVKEVGENAFQNCSALGSVKLGDGLEKVGKSAFRQAGGFTGSLVLPRSLKYVGAGAFYSIGITDLEINSDISTDSDDLDLFINSPFGYCKNLKSITVSEGCTMLDLSFSGCAALCKVSLPQSIRFIGGMGDSDIYIFSGCTALTSINLPNQLKVICSGAFRNTGLTEIIVPESVEEVGAYAFSNCSNLASAQLPSKLHIISEGLFSGCTVLKSFQIPASVATIGNKSFGESGLVSVTLPSGVTEIGKQAFYKCNSLSTINLPKSLIKIGDYAFSDCNALSQISVAPDCQLTSIGEGSFLQCTSLKEFSFPSRVNSIGKSAFSISGLTSLSIPASVSSFGDECFSYCSRLSTVENYSQTPQPVSASIFANVPLGNVRLLVPSASTNLYKSADVWSMFGTIDSMN